MQPMKLFVDTHDQRSETFPAGIAREDLTRNADDGEVVITQAALATELGTAREVVFRALRELTARGLIATRRGRIRLIDARGLARP